MLHYYIFQRHFKGGEQLPLDTITLFHLKNQPLSLRVALYYFHVTKTWILPRWRRWAQQNAQKQWNVKF